MKTNENYTEMLHDLIRIHNDRVMDYEKASRETDPKDADLRSLFSEMATESRRCANELGRYVHQPAGEPVKDVTLHGKLYRFWMDIKIIFSGHDRKTILGSCEAVEDATQRIYDEALSIDPGYPGELKQLIIDQKSSLKKSHDRIKRMRDAQPA